MCSISCNPITYSSFFQSYFFLFSIVNIKQLHKKQRCFDKQVYAFIPFLGTISKKRTALRPPPKKTKIHTDTSEYMYNIINPILKKRLEHPPKGYRIRIVKIIVKFACCKAWEFFFSVGSSAGLWYLQRYVKSNFFFLFATVFRLSMQDIRLSATEWNVFFF